MKLLLALSLLMTSASAHAFTCTEILKGLGLTQNSLGLLGAVDVLDQKTNESVRIFLKQTGKTKTENQEIYDFSVSTVMGLNGEGKLFKDLNARTNLQVIEINYPGFPSGCGLGFYGRQLGPTAVRVSKNVVSISGNTIVLDAKENMVHELQNSLVLKYHGRTVD